MAAGYMSFASVLTIRQLLPIGANLFTLLLKVPLHEVRRFILVLVFPESVFSLWVSMK
jgi:hypothetical protein